jgi:hypothetical protein
VIPWCCRLSTKKATYRSACIGRLWRKSSSASVKRSAIADRLNRIYQLVARTGHLAHFIVFGSFVTAEEYPNDVDIVLLMEDTFDLASVSDEAALVFQHMEADAYFGASVFWVRRSGAIGGEQAMIEYWQVRREGGQRGIVEIIPEGS